MRRESPLGPVITIYDGPSPRDSLGATRGNVLLHVAGTFSRSEYYGNSRVFDGLDERNLFADLFCNSERRKRRGSRRD